MVGLAFLDIGKKLPIQQLSFLFMLLQIGALSNMAVMPETIAQRLVFKFENSDGLYVRMSRLSQIRSLHVSPLTRL